MPRRKSVGRRAFSFAGGEPQLKTHLKVVHAHCAATHYKLGLIYARLGQRHAALREHRILKRLRPDLAEQLYALIAREGDF